MRPAVRRWAGAAAERSERPDEGRRGAPPWSWSACCPSCSLAILVAAQLAMAGASLWSAGIAARAGARAALVGGRADGGGARGAAAGAARGGAGRRRGGRRRGRGAAAAPASRHAGCRARREDEAGPAVDSERGQATVELVAALPALLLAGYVAFQLLAAGYALTLADGAAEAGALALASGRPASRAARDALPGWAADDVERQRPGRPGHRPPAAAGALGGDRRAPHRHRQRRREAAMRRARAPCGCGDRWSAGSARPRAARPIAAALACAGSDPDRAALLLELSDGRAPRPALVASAAARALEERLAAHLPEAGVASRGALCHLTLPRLPRGAGAGAGGSGARPRLARRGARAAGPAPGGDRGRRAPGRARSCCAPTSAATGR